MKTTIALVQFKPKLSSFEESFKRAEQFIKQAKKEKADIICFPESSITGPTDYYELDDINYITNNLPTLYKSTFKTLSKKYDIAIIAGTIEEKLNNNKIVNRCYIFDKGKIVYHYDKIHLFSSEKGSVTPGKDYPSVISIRGVRVAVAICKDLFYPELFQKLSKEGAQMVFVPSMWSAYSYLYEAQNNLVKNYKIKLQSNKLTKVMGESRALENGIFLAFVNCCGSLKQRQDYDVFLGKSFIASPIEGIVCKTNYLNEEVLLIKTLDLKATEDSKIIYDL